MCRTDESTSEPRFILRSQNPESSTLKLLLSLRLLRLFHNSRIQSATSMLKIRNLRVGGLCAAVLLLCSMNRHLNLILLKVTKTYKQSNKRSASIQYLQSWRLRKVVLGELILLSYCCTRRTDVRPRFIANHSPIL